MEGIITTSMWGKNFMIPMYLFFGGLTAGLGIVAVVADYMEERNKAYALLSRMAAYAAIPAWILGSYFVVFHLGRPVRGIFFPLFFSNYGSWMTYGGWAMGLGGPVLVLYTLLRHYDMAAGARRILGVVSIPLMLWIALNTAMLLSAARQVPMWDRLYLPALFINSGLLTGMAMAGLLFILVRKYAPGFSAVDGAPERVLVIGSSVVLVFEIIEAAILYGLIQSIATANTGMDDVSRVLNPQGSLQVYEQVTSGSLAMWFWLGVVALGIVIPIVLGIVELITKRNEELLAGLKFACILLGAVVLRFVVVWGGDMRPLPQISQAIRDLLVPFLG